MSTPAETTSNQPVSSAGRPVLPRLLGMGFGHFANDGAANFLPGVLPAILAASQLPVSWAGGLMTAVLVGQGLQPVVGLLGDRIGGRSLSVFGLLGSSIGAGLVGLVSSPAALLAVLALIGVSNSLFHPQAVAGVRRLASERQGLAMSTFLVGGELGRGIWPVLATLCIAVAGLHGLVILALPGLVGCVFLWRSAPALPRRSRDAARIDWGKHIGPVLTLVAFCGLRSFATFAAVTLLPFLWSEHGGGATAGASLIAVLTVVGVVGNLGGGWLVEYWGARRIMYGSMLLGAFSAAGIALTSGDWVWPLAALMGIGLFATLPLTVLLAQDILPENPSFGSGLTLGLANALAALAVTGVGPMIELVGPAETFWLAAAAGLAACLFVPRRDQVAR